MKTTRAVAETSAPASAGPAGVQLAQFFIPAAASLHERRPRTLKHGDTFAVFDHNGDVLSGPGSPEGIYHRDTRHLSHFYLTIGGARPILLSSTLRDDNATLTCDLTNPDLFDGPDHVEHDLIHVRRSRLLWNGSCFERMVVRNFDASPRIVRLELAFAADFADLFEVRGNRRERRGKTHDPEVRETFVRLKYTGLDDLERVTDIRFEPAPKRLLRDRAEFVLRLAPREVRIIFMEISCGVAPQDRPVHVKFFTALRDARRALRRSSSRATSIATSNDLFNEGIRRSVSDLYMLMTDLPEGPYPYAGIPWFSTVFGRDALITAWEVLWVDPEIARGVLNYLAVNQATTVDPASDAQPGKILHEARQGEMAQLGEVPFRHYYGSVDATPLFVILAGEYLKRTDDVATIRELWPNIVAALRWIDDYGDVDGDGFVEYSRQTPTGLVNQGWKDSHDSIFHADGTIAKGPIALVEVQAYVYGAFESAAEIARRLGRAEAAERLALRAAMLRAEFDKVFFDEDLGTYVLALDGDKKPCRVRSSNAGHALFTGIALEERVKSVVTVLMSKASFSGWGIRTLSVDAPRFNPMSYHNGSVWPHDNAIIGAGFSRYGFRRETAQILTGLFQASTYIDLRRLPELFCGFPRQRAQGPTFYPVACSPQAWAAAAPIALLRSCLGIEFDPAGKSIALKRPLLPNFLDQVTLRGVSLAGAGVDLDLRRSGSHVIVEVLDRQGSIDVLTTN